MSLSLYSKKEPSKVRRRTISRSSSRRSQADSAQSKQAERGASSASDPALDEHPKQRGSSDLDILGVDIMDDQGWDTDLEREDTPPPFDHSGKTAYLEECRRLGVIPTSYFLRHMQDQQLCMKHHGLGATGMRAMTPVLMVNNTILSLDLTDNWLGYEGGLAVCDMLRENCFITDLNLSDNQLKNTAAHLCHIFLQNDTLRRVKLAGNGFDDRSAEHFAEFIANPSHIEYLDLSRNNLCEAAGLCLGPAISENVNITELDLSWNHLRRKGAMAVAAGVKTNVFLKKINLSWNGFGLEGATALSGALKDNSVLEELNITNNRISTEGAVVIGKGLSVNETLHILKMGKNPMQSAGCWGICAAILRNPNCVLRELDFSDILVNQDFEAILQQVKEHLPQLHVTHGDTTAPLKPRKRVHPMVKLMVYIEKNNLRLIDFFNKFDKEGTMSISGEHFRQGLKDAGIPLKDDDIDLLLEELDKDGDGEINYSELVIGHTDFQEREKEERKLRTIVTSVRPVTS
ncbi:uncharacterized protein LOC143274835 [Babylonia areolata]|uniref:uncharacterized protein LOC143274835 n=1 Tax=Babylonia areolata TaxID=304850 RepID=UPI003FD4C52A